MEKVDGKQHGPTHGPTVRMCIRELKTRRDWSSLEEVEAKLDEIQTLHEKEVAEAFEIGKFEAVLKLSLKLLEVIVEED